MPPSDQRPSREKAGLSGALGSAGHFGLTAFFDNLEFLLTRRILINGRRAEEVRVAIVDNQTLDDFEIETKRSGLLRNNIYRGVVSNIAPSLNAAFVDFGDQKNGFLAFNDVVESAYARPVKDTYKIADVLVPGQELIVQVIKDATGLKGAQVTTNISLAGRYLVLRPKDAKSGVSRKIDDDSRADLTQKIRSLDLPDGYGCIVRTNAMDQPRSMLLRDAKALIQLWHKIESEFEKGKEPKLLYNDQDIVVSVMRDYFDATISEVLIDDRSCYERARTYVRATFAGGEDRVHLYEDKMPIFSRFALEKQIEQIYARQVQLPSGGFIVIDPTEALTAIDVNSAHATKRETQDLTAYHTNLEAAAEIGRQLRMRDIGGLIVVDFIDMRLGKHQRDVERVMRNAMARDKARNKVERISANGLLEINRQRISQALSQRTHLECPTCGGRGFIPSAEAIGLTLIREIDARAVAGNLGGVVIKLHPDVAQQLQNERRREFAQMEIEYGIRIEIVACREMSRGDESVEWLTKRQEDALHPERSVSSGEAASIIDVAESYEHQDGGDLYRPNDFEEFSSEEARRRRASRRASRREGGETPREPREPRESRADVRESRADVRESRADVREAVQSDADGVVDHAFALSGMAVLSVLVDGMSGYISEDSAETGARRSRFGGRHRGSRRRESGGLVMDLRMFVLDIVKAVCVHALGLSGDLSRREMVERMPEVSSWLMDSARLARNDANDRVDLLRHAITSRHASARLSCLFEGDVSQADELATLLLKERDEVLGAHPDQGVGVDGGVDVLRQRLSERLARIFGGPEMPVAEVRVQARSAKPVRVRGERASRERRVSSETPEERVVPRVEVDVAAEVVAPNAEVAPSAEVVEQEGRGTRTRNRRRGRLPMSQEDEGLQEASVEPVRSEEPVVPTACHEDGCVVTSDVAIPPMTREVDQVPEVVQEPVVASRARRSRGERRRESERRSALAEGESRESVSPEAVTGSEARPVVLAESPSVVEATEVPASVETVESAEGTLSRRRSRQTRRGRMDGAGQGDVLPLSVDVSQGEKPRVIVDPVSELEPVVAHTEAEASVLEVPVRTGAGRRARRRVSPVDAETLSETVVEPEVQAVQESTSSADNGMALSGETRVSEKDEGRRSRRPRRPRRGEAVEPSVEPSVEPCEPEVREARREDVEKPVVSEKSVVSEKPVESERQDGRRSRGSRRRSSRAENVEFAVEAPVAEVEPVGEAPVGEAPVAEVSVLPGGEVRSTRRVRRARAVPLNLEGYVLAEPVAQGVCAPKAPETPEPVDAVESVPVEPVTPRRRRTRSSAVRVEQESAAPEAVVPEASGAASLEETRPRVRRTRRSRPEGEE